MFLKHAVCFCCPPFFRPLLLTCIWNCVWDFRSIWRQLTLFLGRAYVLHSLLVSGACPMHRVLGLGVLGFNASATARVISRRWNDDEISFLVEETGVPGENHRPTAMHRVGLGLCRILWAHPVGQQGYRAIKPGMLTRNVLNKIPFLGKMYFIYTKYDTAPNQMQAFSKCSVLWYSLLQEPVVL